MILVPEEYYEDRITVWVSGFGSNVFVTGLPIANVFVVMRECSSSVWCDTVYSNLIWLRQT